MGWGVWDGVCGVVSFSLSNKMVDSVTLVGVAAAIGMIVWFHVFEDGVGAGDEESTTPGALIAHMNESFVPLKDVIPHHVFDDIAEHIRTFYYTAVRDVITQHDLSALKQCIRYIDMKFDEMSNTGCAHGSYYDRLIKEVCTNITGRMWNTISELNGGKPLDDARAESYDALSLES